MSPRLSTTLLLLCALVVSHESSDVSQCRSINWPDVLRSSGSAERLFSLFAVRPTLPQLRDALSSPQSAFRVYVYAVMVPIGLFVFVLAMWTYTCCLGVCNRAFYCCWPIKREPQSRFSIRCTKLTAAGMSLLGIAAAFWLYVVADSIGEGIRVTDCAVGLAISDAIDSDSCQHCANKSVKWVGLRQAYVEGKRALSLIDQTMNEFITYATNYPKELLSREGQHADYIYFDLYQTFKDRRVHSPENQSQTFPPAAIDSLPETAERLLSDIRKHAAPAILGFNVTYEAARFVFENLNREVFEEGLNEIRKQSAALESTETEYWNSRTARRPVEETIASFLDFVGYSALALSAASFLVLCLVLFKTSRRGAMHCSHSLGCIGIVGIAAILAMVFPAAVILSDACYAAEDTNTPEHLRYLELSDEHTRLLKFCMFDSGNVAGYYNLSEQLEFAQSLRTMHESLGGLIRNGLPLVFQGVQVAATHLDEHNRNLHLEPAVVNRSVAALNRMTNLYDPRRIFPNCTCLIDMWKLRDGQCENESYIIDSQLGSPSCLRVENWEEGRLFTDRYTPQNLPCAEGTEIIPTIKAQFEAVSNFAYEVHVVYDELKSVLGIYNTSLEKTYRMELETWEKFEALVTAADELIRAIGDPVSGFLVHVNCNYVREAYQRVRGGVCVQLLGDLRLLVLSMIVYMVTMMIAIAAGLLLAQKTRTPIVIVVDREEYRQIA